MESDSEESRRSPNTAEVCVTAARRRRLQRRRAAAVQLAAAAAAVVVETLVMEIELRPDRVRRCRAITSMDDWPAFAQLVVAPPRDCVAMECQLRCIVYGHGRENLWTDHCRPLLILDFLRLHIIMLLCINLVFANFVVYFRFRVPRLGTSRR
jgi:hypothetical protein